MIYTASHNHIMIKHVILTVSVSMYITYKFCARNTSMLTLLGFNADQLDVTILPDVLNCRSEVQLVAHMQRYFLESFASTGYTVE